MLYIAKKVNYTTGPLINGNTHIEAYVIKVGLYVIKVGLPYY